MLPGHVEAAVGVDRHRDFENFRPGLLEILAHVRVMVAVAPPLGTVVADQQITRAVEPLGNPVPLSSLSVTEVLESVSVAVANPLRAERQPVLALIDLLLRDRPCSPRSGA